MFRRRRPPLAEIQAKRIALIKPSALGDIIHALPVLEAVRQRFPAAHIGWVVNRSYEPLLERHPALDETIPVDRQSAKRGLGAMFRTALHVLKQLRRRRFDLVIDLQGLLRSGLMAGATGAQRRVGLGTAREGSRYFYSDVIATPEADKQHAVDRYWLVAEALGVGHLTKRFRVPIAPEARWWVDAQLRDLPRPWLFLGVGARWLTKRWPPEHFAELVRRAQKQFGGSALFIGAPDEAILSQKVISLIDGPARDFTGKTTLPQLAALLDRADVMVSNDTGPLHVAAALGRPVVAPYTCTQTRRHGPFGAMRGAVESTVWCQGSYIRQCDRLECMTDLQPDRLWIYLSEILREWARLNRSA